MIDVISPNPEKPLELSWQHEGATKQAEIVPKREKSIVNGDIKEVGRIGIAARVSFRPAGILESFGAGFGLTLGNIELGLKSLSLLVTGRASIKDLGGPIAIAKMSGESARGGLASLILFIAFISINIGLLNILPVPVLDGGHLVIILIEAVARRPISTRIKLAVQQVGLVLILALMAVIIWNDVGRVGLLAKLKHIF
jgi:regulator of sigma E protease